VGVDVHEDKETSSHRTSAEGRQSQSLHDTKVPAKSPDNLGVQMKEDFTRF